jgi:hypothetical protein
MALFTTYIQWRTPFVNNNRQHLANLFKSHFINAGWTVLDDQSTQSDPYVVVTFNRATGFIGDNIIVQVGCLNDGSEVVRLTAYSNWDLVTHTGTDGTTTTYNLTVSYTSDCDIYISTDSKFTTISAQVNSSNSSNFTIGICAYERLAGDNDLGTFYGTWAVIVPTNVTSPLLWDKRNNIGLPCSTILGGATSLTGVNEAGNDILLPFYVSAPTYGKHKGELYGVRICSISSTIVTGTITPIIDGYQWRIINEGNQCWAFPVTNPPNLVH